MSTSSPNGHLHPSMQYEPGALRSSQPRHSTGNAVALGVRKPKKGSPLQKLAGMFKKDRSKENGTVPVRPSCFADDFDTHSTSPEPNSPSGKGRSSSQGIVRATNKIKGKAAGREPRSPSGTLWRPKGRCAWESDSGRHMTLVDTEITELSRVEVQALQRIAVTQLQGMDVPVSHGMLKGTRNVFQRISFNTFKQKKVTPERADVGVFGQPLVKVLDQPRPTSGSGSSTPIPSPPTPTASTPMLIHPPPLSPTGSEASFLDSDLNPTTLLLEELSASASLPSPRARRRMSLVPADRQVPTLVLKAIQHLDSNGVKMEGLFRISGAKSRITEIREQFDSGEDVALTEDTNPHDVASLLKEFFRSLPEPLLTKELFAPFLSTRKVTNSGQRRDMLRLLCFLLPQANRDTLQELLQFLSRVALHSDGIILIDGTEEVGNRMNERNLAMILGPNILHKESKKPGGKGPGEYQVIKQDHDELLQVCQVMEDLIHMHLSIFTVPARLYDATLRHLIISDPDAVHIILKRKCLEQGLYLDEEEGFSRSRSSEALRKISQSSFNAVEDTSWRRSRSLSDTQRTLDEAIRSLEACMTEELSSEDVSRPRRHYSSNDSAMGDSETMVSPIQSAHSEPSTLSRHRQVCASMDSAFSNSSFATSCDGANCDRTSVGSDSPFAHTRMSSGISVSPTGTRARDSPEQAPSPHTRGRGKPPHLTNAETVSLPTMSPERDLGPHEALPSPILGSTAPRRSKHPKPPTQPTQTAGQRRHWKVSKTMPRVPSIGTYSPNRSPILTSKEALFRSEPQLDCISSDHTPTESTSNITASLSATSCDRHSDDGTVI